MKLILLSLILSIAAHAQFGASKATTLVAAAEVVTIQGYQAANVRLAKKILLLTADVYCSVACDLTLERDGTIASTTTLTPYQLNLNGPAPTALAYASSNAGVGTVMGRYSIPAGGTIAIKLEGKQLVSGFQNMTLRTSSITGDVKINIQWTED